MIDSNSQNISIRSEIYQDIKQIDHVLIQAFLNHPHSIQNEHLIVRKLRDSKCLSIGLIAEFNQIVIGYIAISPVKLKTNTNTNNNDLVNPVLDYWFGLGPVAVLPEFQNLGIGSKLIDTALSKLKQNTKAQGCVVLGDPHYYARFGFKSYEHLILEGVPVPYFQAMSFKGYIPNATVEYDRAFQTRS